MQEHSWFLIQFNSRLGAHQSQQVALALTTPLHYINRVAQLGQSNRAMMYSILGNLFPSAAMVAPPQRIVFVRPCCIGDVVMATAALSALRSTFPAAHISWALGPWSARAVAHHPDMDAVLDIGSDMPLRTLPAMLRFVRQLRAGDYDMAISLVRSPMMSLALYLAGIPLRVGLDSGGRGFGYNLRVPIDPDAREHESAIYLKVICAVAGKTVEAWENLPVTPAAQESIRHKLSERKIAPPFIVAHPGGGSNPGMQLAHKRYPPAQLAAMLNQVAEKTGASVILLGGPTDEALVAAVKQGTQARFVSWVGELSFPEIGALAAEALLYIGNDTGLTHLAAASGARAVMLMGPTDPQRYAPYTDDHLALWKPTALRAGGVAAAQQSAWDWARDGIAVDDAVARILAFLNT